MEFLTPKKTAEILGICLNTLRNWSNSGLLPSIRTLGGHRRYKKSDVESMKELCSPKQASKKLGVCQDTLRKWERSNKISVIKTSGGHRKYKIDQ